MNLFSRYLARLNTEFQGYCAQKFGKDLLAGITVAAVSLPLALAFGVSNGVSAAAGLVTAIISGLIISGFSGASYQISGPSGATAAILLALIAQHGFQGMFIACLISGVIRLLAGIFKAGRLVSFIPLPVMTGFTSGIAILIAFGQLEALTGLSLGGGASIIKQLGALFTSGQWPLPAPFLVGIGVILFMVFYPKKWNALLPGSLAAIVLATLLASLLKLPVASVGEIPKTLFLQTRLSLTQIDFSTIGDLLLPGLSIAALGMIESLLCGASAGRMKNETLDTDIELVAQGLGNIVLPFLGGVPATAALARTSVAIKSGAQTRLAGIIHALVLLICMFALANIMAAIPLCALAGVLIVTAWRMNDWQAIRGLFDKKLKAAIPQFFITMLATAVFDLTIAIFVGVLAALVLFVIKASDLRVDVQAIDPKKLPANAPFHDHYHSACVVYVTGPIYFANAYRLDAALAGLSNKTSIIFSMRGVSAADDSGVIALETLCKKLQAGGTQVLFACVQPQVMDLFTRCGLRDALGAQSFFWSADQALVCTGSVL